MRIVKNTEYAEVCDALSVEWGNYLRDIFQDIIVVPLLNKPDHAIRVIEERHLDGVVFSNGNDWGEAEARDVTERAIFNYVIKRRLPILGVCRGFQVLNVLCGGTLDKDIQSSSGENHVATIHDVEIVANDFLRGYTVGQTISVNSFHRQGVLQGGIASNLKIFAKTKSGVVEGFYHPKELIVGIQWHPERNNPAAELDKGIVTDFFMRER